MQEKYRKLTNCRICKGSNLEEYLDLGEMPLVNSFPLPGEIDHEEKFPLEVLLCHDCHLSQLSIVVDPSLLFRNYVYRSSMSNDFKSHCNDLAKELNSYACKKGDLIVDIASNDGALLHPFKRIGNRVLGIDPAINLAKIANEEGIETIPEFWNEGLAKKILQSHGPAKIITAFNIFAHVDDVHSFISGVKILLDKDGFFVFESPHIQDLITKVEFDTIYHEHLSYLSSSPVARLLSEHGLRIAKIEKHNIHGGSIRGYIEHNFQNRSNGSSEKVLKDEEISGIYNPSSYYSFSEQVKSVRKNLNSLLHNIKRDGQSISLFGASAKGNILLNYCGIDHQQIDYAFDHTPEKQGRLTPITHIPVIHPDLLLSKMPDYLLLTAWNFSREIMEKTKAYQENGGKYIIPLPQLRVL